MELSQDQTQGDIIILEPTGLVQISLSQITQWTKDWLYEINQKLENMRNGESSCCLSQPVAATLNLGLMVRCPMVFVLFCFFFSIRNQNSNFIFLHPPNPVVCRHGNTCP